MLSFNLASPFKSIKINYNNKFYAKTEEKKIKQRRHIKLRKRRS